MQHFSQAHVTQSALDFWFGAPSHAEYGKPRALWFTKNPEFDAQIHDQFKDWIEMAASGQWDDWAADPNSALALIILLDQFPRNAFRGQAKSFAFDNKALALAKSAIAAGHDQKLPIFMRSFFYLPFEHSEALADQHEAVRLFKQLDDGGMGLEWAIKHLNIIERFGRFPHRNAILGRVSTAEELAFLQEPGSSF